MNIELQNEETNRNLSHDTANCDKAEEKELNLCEILKEGLKVYSPLFGDGETEHVYLNYIDIGWIGRNGSSVTWDFRKDGSRYLGLPIIFPSRDLYEKYPLDAKKAWNEWIEANKPKRWRAEKGNCYWFLTSQGYIKVANDYHFESNDNDYKAMNYFRTEEEARQAAEAVKKCLEEFHKSNQQ